MVNCDVCGMSLSVKNLARHRGRRLCLSTSSVSARMAYARAAYRPATTDAATSPVATVTTAKARSCVSQLFRIHSLGASALSMESVAARVFPTLDESTRTICVQAAIQAVRSARAAVRGVCVRVEPPPSTAPTTRLPLLTAEELAHPEALFDLQPLSPIPGPLMEELHDTTTMRHEGANFRYGYPVRPSTHQPSLLPDPIILVPPGGGRMGQAHEGVEDTARTKKKGGGEKVKEKGSETRSERSHAAEEISLKKRREAKRAAGEEKRDREKPTEEVVVRKRNEEVDAHKKPEQATKKAVEKKVDDTREVRKTGEDKRREREEVPSDERDAKKRRVGVVKPKMDGEEDWTRNRDTAGEGRSKETEPRRDDRRHRATERERSTSPRRARRHSRSRSPGRSSRDRTDGPRHRRASPHRSSSPPRRLDDHPVWAAFRRMLEAYEHR